MNDAAVIIPVYNVGNYLPRCLDSLLDQTLPPQHILLIDDGSSDTSGAICDEYAEKHESIHAWHQANGGVSSARNLGLELWEKHFPTQYVLFVDPDDWVERHYVEKLVQSAQNVELGICGYQKVLLSGEMILDVVTYNRGYPSSAANLVQKLIPLHRYTQLFSSCNKCFQGDIIRQNHLRFPATRRLEDAFFIYEYLLYCKDINFIPDALYRYAVYKSERKTATTRFLGEMCRGQFLLHAKGQQLLEHFSEQGLPQADLAAFCARLTNHLRSGVLGEITNSLPLSNLSVAARRDYIKELWEKYRATSDSFVPPEDNGRDLCSRSIQMLLKIKFYLGVAFLIYVIQGIRKLKWYFFSHRHATENFHE